MRYFVGSGQIKAGDVTTPRGQIGVKTDNTILTFYRTGLNMKFAWNDHVIQALLVLLGNKTDGAIEACFRLYYSVVPRCHLDASNSCDCSFRTFFLFFCGGTDATATQMFVGFASTPTSSAP